MWLKIIIVVLFIAVVVSLSSALNFLLRDKGSPKKRTLYALGIRVSLALLLFTALFYGFYTGELSSTAPWDRGPTQHSSAPIQQ